MDEWADLVPCFSRNTRTLVPKRELYWRHGRDDDRRDPSARDGERNGTLKIGHRSE